MAIMSTMREGGADLRSQTGNRKFEAYGDSDSRPPKLGNKRPAKGAGLMDDEELQANVSAMLVDCVTFIDTELSPERAVATSFYLGKPFGNEQEGRSQVVLTTVRDSVLAVIPPILRVFFSSDRAVEFIPTRPDAIEQAAQASDYVQQVFAEDNRGFHLAHAVLKDGLVRKVGVFKWGWDDSEATVAYRLINVTEEELEALEDEDDITITRVVRTAWRPADAHPPATGAAIPLGPSRMSVGLEQQNRVPGTAEHPETEPGVVQEAPESSDPLAPPAEPLYLVELTRVESEGKPKIWSLPPEEFVFSREARSLGYSTCVAHRTNKRRGELVAMGYDEEVILEHQADDTTLRNNLEQIARREVIEAGSTQDVPTGPENDEILYVEAYVHVDYDGDGIAELRKVCTMGLGYHVVANEPIDERPFAIFCPDPEPHTMLGQSWADRTMDLQMIQSNILRGVMDSLSASIFPRMGYVEGQVSTADILNTDVGAPIRMRSKDAIMPLTTPFTGKEGLDVIQYLDTVTERRTSQSDGVSGLDADALQSSTEKAVNAAINSSQAQQEMLARFFAETLRDLFKGILRLLITHQPKKKVTRLRGKWVQVDPRVWDANMDVRVNVGLGNGLTEEKVQTLIAIAAQQESILKQMGPQNPLVTLQQYGGTLRKIAELKGFIDPNEFFGEVPPNWQPPPPPGANQPSPEMIQVQGMLQIEKEKNLRQLAIKEAELQLKQKQMLLDNDIALKKAADDFTLRRYAIDAQYKVNYTEAQMEADAGQQERWLAAQGQAHEQALSMHQQAFDQSQAADQQDFEQDQAAQASQAAQNGGEGDTMASDTSQTSGGSSP